MLELQRWLYAEVGGQLKSFASGIDPLTLLTSISIVALFGLVHAFMPGSLQSLKEGAFFANVVLGTSQPPH